MKKSYESDELKPCPFCGGKARIFFIYGAYWVGCPKCMIDIPPVNTHKYKRKYAIQKVIETWNTRKGEAHED